MLKIVNFSLYCETCKDKDTPESESPCRECLRVPAREDSRRPEKYILQEGKSNGKT